MRGILALLLVGTAIVQAVLPVRVFVAIRRGARDRPSEIPIVVPTASIVACMVLAIVLGLLTTAEGSA